MAKKELGIFPKKVIYINKTYKNTICSNGAKMHSMVVSDAHKDQTGTWITDGTYCLVWFDNNDYMVNDRVTINNILKIIERSYTNKQGQFVKEKIITVEILNNSQQQNNYNYNSNNSDNNGYSNYGNYQNYNDYDY